MNSPQAGWHPDPNQPGQLRWWDGTQWTSQTRPAAAPTTFPSEPAPTGANPFGSTKSGPNKGLLIGIGAAVLVIALVAFLVLGRDSDGPSKEATVTNDDLTVRTIDAPAGAMVVVKVDGKDKANVKVAFGIDRDSIDGIVGRDDVGVATEDDLLSGSDHVADSVLAGTDLAEKFETGDEPGAKIPGFDGVFLDDVTSMATSTGYQAVLPMDAKVSFALITSAGEGQDVEISTCIRKNPDVKGSIPDGDYDEVRSSTFYTTAEEECVKELKED